MNKKVLLVGESWTSTTMEVKGFNSFLSSKYETGLGWIDHAIEAAGYELVYMQNHLAAEEFPFTADKLQDYSCVILSDVGADTLLIPPKTFSSSQKFPNRCQLIKDYVLCGGSLFMIGGYMTFSGIGGQGKWWSTPVQDILPVTLLPWDDRMEHCEGVVPQITVPSHPVFRNISGEIPAILGYNRSTIKPEAEEIATICGDPFLAFARYGEGKSGVLTTDCAPHWAPPEFCNWIGYNTLFKNILDYLMR